MIAVTLSVELFLMITVGFFSIRSGIVKDDFTNKLNSFVMQITLPAMIFNSISNAAAFTSEALSNCIIVLIASTLVMVASLGLGQFFYWKNGKGGMARIIRYALTFTHFSFMGIPIMGALFGDVGTLYYVFFMVPVRIFYYTLSKPLMTPSDKKEKSHSASELLKGVFLNPALVTVALGMVFWIGGLKMPTMIDYCIRQVGSLCSPLGLILCGMRLGGCDLKGLLKPQYLGIPLLRLVMMPAIFYFPTRMLMQFGIDPVICNMIFIYTALPIAALLPVYTMQYDPDPDNQFMAAGTSAVASILSMLTIPLWCLAAL